MSFYAWRGASREGVGPRAPPTFPRFARFGSKLLVVWDPEDEVSSGLLHGAIVAGLALAQRKRVAADAADIKALADIENRLLKEIEHLEKRPRRSANRQARSGTRFANATDELRRVVDKGKATLRALEIELDEEHRETASPIIAGHCEACIAVNEGGTPSVA